MYFQKKIITGGMDGDSSPRLVAPNACLNLMNARVSVSKNGRDLRIENINGTVLKINNKVPAYGTNQCIGSISDENRNRIIFFLWNSFGDNGIYCYDKINDVFYAILYDSQVNGGLNFSKSYRIDRNAKVVGDLLLWTDNNNEPRCINIERGIKANQSGYVTTITPYIFPLDQTNITLIKQPPIYELNINSYTDSSFENDFIRGNFFQFTYYFDFIDNQSSALADYSAIFPYKKDTDTTNCIQVSLPSSSIYQISQDVQRIHIVAKYGNDGKSVVVKTYDKANQNDLAAINSYNSGGNLVFKFYNNQSEFTLDSVTANNNFDNVPLKAKTLEVARNRTFLGNIKSGYSSTSNTSLSFETTFGTLTDYVWKSGSQWVAGIQFLDKYRRKCGTVVAQIPFNTPELTYSSSNYASIVNFILSNANALVEIPDWAYYYQIVVTKNQTRDSFMQGWYFISYYANKNSNGSYSFGGSQYFSGTTSAIAINISTFTSYGIGYVFTEGDEAILYLNNGTNYHLPILSQDGEYIYVSAQDIGNINSGYKWAIGNSNIQDNWDFIAILNGGYNTTSFFPSSQTVAQQATFTSDKYLTQYILSVRDNQPHTFTVVVDNLQIQATATDLKKFDINIRIAYGANGGNADYLDFLLYEITDPVSNQIYTINVSQSISITTPQHNTRSRVDLGLIFSDDGLSSPPNVIGGNIYIYENKDINKIELYTPHKTSDQYEPFYECSKVYNVINPTTNTRQYATLTDTLIGDAYIVGRTISGMSGLQVFEAMSLNDKYWKIWNRNIGWVNEIDYIGQKQLTDTFVCSDTYIEGSQTNGLNKFEDTNIFTVGTDGGEIQKLQLTNKRQEDGTVMLVICSEQTLSAYLGEVQLYAAAQKGDIATTNSVVGTINTLKNRFGTRHPESIIEYMGIVFGIDDINNVAWQYASDGIEDVSRFKQSRFFRQYLENYLLTDSNTIDTLNGFHHLPSCIDPFTKEAIFTLPALIDENSATILPSYSSVPSYATSIINRFDIYDGLGKTMSYSFLKNYWGSNYEFMGEWYDYLENTLFGFKNGQLYIHNADSVNTNNFYGMQYPVRLCVVWNDEPSAIKDILQTTLEASAIPNFTVLYSDNPNIQITDLSKNDTGLDGQPTWDNLEGALNNTFLKDRLSPNTGTNVPEQNLYLGDVIKSPTPYIMYEWQAYNGLFYLDFINLVWALSKGQKKLLTPTTYHQYKPIP